MQSLGRAGKTSRRTHSRQNRALVTARASVYLSDIPCKIEGRIVPDTLGYRKRIGLVVPSTNTTVQPETDAIRVPGVTCHTGRVTIKERPLNTEEAFNEHMQVMRDGMGTAIDQTLTAGLDHLIMGIALETFWGGVVAADKLQTDLAPRAAVSGTIRSAALVAALEKFGARKLTL